MKAWRLLDLSADRIHELAPRGLLLLPLAALEPHGPHLPLGLRLRLVERLAADAADHLSGRNPQFPIFLDVSWPFLPALRCTPEESAAPETDMAMAALRALLHSRAVLGIRQIMLVAMETDSNLLPQLRATIQDVESRTGIRIREPGSAFYHHGMAEVDDLLRELGLDPACEVHGDIRHTSMLLYLDEKAVGPYQDLPPCRVHLAARQLAGARNWQELGAENGYIGTPAAATVKAGKRIYKAWRNRFADAGQTMIDGGEPPDLPLLLRLSLKLR